MLKDLKNNESGIILVTVIVITIVIVILTVGILSINTGQVISGENEIRRVKAQILSQGAMWLAIARRNNGENPTNFSFSQPIDNRIFSANIVTSGPVATPNQTNKYLINLTY